MRKLIFLVLVLATLYGGYWFVGRSQVQSRMIDALAEIDAGPQDISYADLSTTGFPSRFDTTVTELEFSDPSSRVTWRAPSFQFFALAYRPNEVIAVFPNEQSLSIDGEEFNILSDDMRASGKVSASTSLAFQTATITMEAPRVQAAGGAELAMSSLLAAMRLAPETIQTYDLFLTARDIALPVEIQRLLDPSNLQPETIESLRFEATMDLTSQLALNNPSTTPPEIEALELSQLELTWGDMSLTAIGKVLPDDAGVLDGSVTITARNWRQALELGLSNGMISEDNRFLITGIAENLDETPDFPDTLTLTVTIAEGMMSLGGMVLGPAPTLR